MVEYPTGYTITAERSREDVERRTSDVSSGGTVRVRNITAKQVYRFAITHRLITRAAAEALRTWCEANENDDVLIAWDDGNYLVTLLSWDIRWEVGSWWGAEIKAIGVRYA